MIPILLVAVNSRYSHTNLAVRSISTYAEKYACALSDGILSFDEWTISHHVQDILRGIVERNPTIVIFSVYIWNTELIFNVIRELRKILPHVLIVAGGPDVSYRIDEVCARFSELDCILCGEGEETVLELVQLYKATIAQGAFSRIDFLTKLHTVAGVFVRCSDGLVNHGGERALLCDLSRLAFPYPKITEPDTRLYYYETSRGCPFLCSYCLSSIDKNVRFMPLERVFEDFQRFMDARVRIVKLTDRTFNLDTKRYLAIWQYLCANHNGYTLFHFEISAQHLDAEALDFLQGVPAGVMQFEIGIQSTNPKTLAEIRRPVDLKILADNICRIPKTIHCHLDLIAGLPHENLAAFEKSFNFALLLYPDMLQLGFLKILSGTKMQSYAKNNNFVWFFQPPHEVLQTPDMGYADLYFLHDIEQVLDWYYNSGTCKATMKFILNSVQNPFDFFSQMVKNYRNRNIFGNLYKVADLFGFFVDFLAEYAQKDYKMLYELLRFDFLCIGKISVFPVWFTRHYDKDAHHKSLLEQGSMHSTREAYSNSAFELFTLNPVTMHTRATAVLFLYSKRGEKKSNVKVILVPSGAD